MIAVDCTAEIPRASSRLATVASAAHAETTDTLVRIGRARLNHRSSGSVSARRGSTIMAAASTGPATRKTTTIPGNPTWNAPRVHSQPKTTMAAETIVKTSHWTMCAGDGIQSVRTPNATKSVADTIANVPADSDAVGPAATGRMIA